MNFFCYFFFAFTFFFISCSEKQKESLRENEPIKTPSNPVTQKGTIGTVFCDVKSDFNYSFYLPHNYSEKKKLPLIVFFDAHARGQKPLKLYKDLADKYGFILAGSNNSKNGLSSELTLRIIQALLLDVKNKFSIDTSRIYTSGFSGGARVATIAALNNKDVKGVIACAAGIPFDVTSLPKTLNYIGLVGLEDFNYVELKEQDAALDRTETTHELIVFKGKHEWPGKNTMDMAFRWLQLQAMNQGAIKKDESFIKQTHTLFQDSMVQDNYSLLQIQRERELQEKYVRALSEKDLSWWKQEVSILNSKAAGNSTTAYLYKRLLNYISMGCYMYANHALTQGVVNEAIHFTTIYEMVDPENPTVYYFKANIYCTQNREEVAFSLLKKSAAMGFDDVEKIRNDKFLRALKKNYDLDEIIDQVQINFDK